MREFKVWCGKGNKSTDSLVKGLIALLLAVIPFGVLFGFSVCVEMPSGIEYTVAKLILAWGFGFWLLISSLYAVLCFVEWYECR